MSFFLPLILNRVATLYFGPVAVASESAPADWILNTPSDYCRRGIQGVGFWPEGRSAMDTMTYASVAMLPKSIAEEHTRFVRQDFDHLPLDLSMIKR
jgi:hypothetical protein